MGLAGAAGLAPGARWRPGCRQPRPSVSASRRASACSPLSSTELSEQRRRQERTLRFGLEQRLGTIEAGQARMLRLLSGLTDGATVASPSSSGSGSGSGSSSSSEETSSSEGEDSGDVGGDVEVAGDTGGGVGGIGRRGRRRGRRPRSSSWRVRRRRSRQMRAS